MEYNINNTMKTIYHIKASLMALAAMVACTEMEIRDESQDATNNGLLQELCITGKDFQLDGETRSSVTIGESGASFAWDEDDVIGIFPDKGDQVSFAMDEGAGTQTATFSGGGWALKSSAKYAAYYPHVYENRDLTAIPVSYVGQTQNGNGTTDHIGAYDFMAAGVSTPENGAVAFDMQHLGALVQLTITVPEPSTLTKVVLSSSTEFTETGTIDLTANTPTINADTQSNTFEIALNNVTTAETNENVVVYFMVAPIDLTDNELKATIHFADETIREVEITGKNLQAGKAYRLAAEIEANFYLDGVAYMSNAGILSELISAEDKKTITSLKIVGKINGSDIITLNAMSALKSLDLSKANIVSGGKAYEDDWDEDDECPLYTKNNIIGAQMFWELKLEEIILPDNITSIEKRAFQNCTKLVSITLPSTVTSIGKMAFCNCDELKSVTISGDLMSIGVSCFGMCEKLESINIPNSVTSLGTRAFYSCSSLKSVNIPPVSEIYEETFYLCKSLTSISIPNTVIRINEDAFMGCDGLTEIHIPSSVEYLSGFMNCDGLTEISIPSSVRAINDYAFSSCSNLKQVTIPSSVITIGNHAFGYCTNLTSVTIPDNVTSIGSYAFEHCSGLKGTLTIPNKVSYINDCSFQGCSGLTSIIVGNNVRTIGWNAFRGCTGVKTVTLNDLVDSIDALAFGEMELTSFTCLKQNPPILSGDAFYNATTDVLYVPSGSKDKYIESQKWNAFAESIIELEN